MGKRLEILKLVVIVILTACLQISCTSLHAYGIALITPYDGKVVIKNEKNTVQHLENVIQNYDGYTMRAFDRKAISYKVKKTNVTTHSFYVIFMPDGTYHTLSFSATGKLATSQGAWAMDTETDIASYRDFLYGNNKWGVREIVTDNGINTPLTIGNILTKIQNNITYYYRSTINRNDNHDNCNTALLETLAENG
ncbi:hypothetical protein AGMMS49587_11560 [Spirochaetia bacterium]|nr:hypothetical protein AGMMS49587_11560 [Spirochaetia bacterium]